MESINNTQKEFILCASIKWGNTIISAHRHVDCYKILDSLVKNILESAYPGRDKQGFLTSHNRFVDRKEAFKIAKDNNQIYHKFHGNMEEGELTNEDLY